MKYPEALKKNYRYIHFYSHDVKRTLFLYHLKSIGKTSILLIPCLSNSTTPVIPPFQSEFKIRQPSPLYDVHRFGHGPCIVLLKLLNRQSWTRPGL